MAKGFCVKCNEIRNFGPERTINIKGKPPVFKGNCPVCGTMIQAVEDVEKYHKDFAAQYGVDNIVNVQAVENPQKATKTAKGKDGDRVIKTNVGNVQVVNNAAKTAKKTGKVK